VQVPKNNRTFVIKRCELFMLPMLVMAIMVCGHSYCQEMVQEFKFENFQLEASIFHYPEFQKVDSVPANTLIEYPPSPFTLPNADFYLHKSPDNFSFLKLPIKFILATTNKQNQLLALHVVSYYKEDFSNRMNEQFGHWQAAGSGGIEQDTIPDEKNLSFCIWDYNNHHLELSTNRNRYFSNRLAIDMEDYVIVSFKVRRYFYEIRGLKEKK
jgi:hypothetical protein